MKTIYKAYYSDGTDLDRSDHNALERAAKKTLGGSKSYSKSGARVSKGTLTSEFFNLLEVFIGDFVLVSVSLEEFSQGQMVGVASINENSSLVLRNDIQLNSEDCGNWVKRLMSRTFEKSHKMINNKDEKVTYV